MSEGCARRGRRPGSPDTRGAILDAARAAFESAGFEGTSIRGVARAAGVDAALVHHYFGDKLGLLLASVRLGFDPRTLIDKVAAQGLDGAGPRIVATALAVYESPIGRAAGEAIRQHPGLAATIVETFVGAVETHLDHLVPGLSAVERRERLSVMQAVMSGLVVGRLLLDAGPVSQLPPARCVEVFGPVLQAGLEGRLTGRGSPRVG